MNYSDAFTLQALVNELISMRLKSASKRHTANIHRKLSPAAPRPDLAGSSELDHLFPPRSQWKRRGKARSRQGKAAMAQSLRLTIRPHMQGGPEALRQCVWGRNILTLHAEIHQLALHPEQGLTPPRPHKISKGNGEYREIQIFTDFAEKVFLKLLNRYLLHHMDPLLGDEVLAFRKRQSDSRTAVVNELKALADTSSPLYAGEVDIKKFFDQIPQTQVRKAFNRASQETADGIHPLAADWIERYLAAFAYEGCPGSFRARGLPQRGILSPLLCNLVLREADLAIKEAVPYGLTYYRYCDDVLFLHERESACRRAMDSYCTSLRELGLTPHDDVSLSSGLNTFLAAKTRSPYRWADRPDTPNSHPWVSFLGYQVHARGKARIHPHSLKRHQTRLDAEVERIFRYLEKSNRRTPRQTYVLLQQYLLHKAVGRVLPEEHLVKSPHWAAAFRGMDFNEQSQPQLRLLDRQMGQRLCEIRRRLKELLPEDMGLSQSVRYAGAPTSYYRRFARPGAPRPNLCLGGDSCSLEELLQLLSTECVHGYTL